MSVTLQLRRVSTQIVFWLTKSNSGTFHLWTFSLQLIHISPMHSMEPAGDLKFVAAIESAEELLTFEQLGPDTHLNPKKKNTNW